MSASIAVGPAVAATDNGCARVLLLNRPDAANALSSELVDALHDELDRAVTDDVRVLVLRGVGRHFCGGFDLGALSEETDASLLLRFARIGLLFERLAAASFVTVAVTHGSAVGAGADLVAACDHRLGTPDSTLRFPGSAFGVVLGVGRLSALVGTAKATQLVTGAGKIRAVEAAAVGLLSAVVEPDEVEDALGQIVAAAAGPPLATLPALVRAARPGPDPAALADLVRSIASHPGLSRRLAEYVSAGAGAR